MKKLLIFILPIISTSVIASNDPTRPPNFKKTLVSEPNENLNSGEKGEASSPTNVFKVSMIAVNNKNNFAVINGKTVSEGEKVNDATVKSINSNEVSLELNGETTQLLLTGIDVISKAKRQ